MPQADRSLVTLAPAHGSDFMGLACAVIVAGMAGILSADASRGAAAVTYDAMAIELKVTPCEIPHTP